VPPSGCNQLAGRVTSRVVRDGHISGEPAIQVNNVDLTIDASTGLPSASRDVSLIQTDLEYDALGRLS